jgi:hypothetical protein
MGACVPEADLAVTLTADAEVIKAQQPVHFTAVVKNLGRGEAMPALLTLAYPPTAALGMLGGAGFGCQSAAGGAVCTLDKLAAGGSATLSMTLVAPLVETIFNVSAQAKAPQPDPVPENNFVTLLVKNAAPGPGGDPISMPTPMDGKSGCAISDRPVAPLSWLSLLLLPLLLLRRRQSADQMLPTDRTLDL